MRLAPRWKKIRKELERGQRPDAKRRFIVVPGSHGIRESVKVLKKKRSVKRK